LRIAETHSSATTERTSVQWEEKEGSRNWEQNRIKTSFDAGAPPGERAKEARGLHSDREKHVLQITERPRVRIDPSIEPQRREEVDHLKGERQVERKSRLAEGNSKVGKDSCRDE
jgi:hypothetical protein